MNCDNLKLHSKLIVRDDKNNILGETHNVILQSGELFILSALAVDFEALMSREGIINAKFISMGVNKFYIYYSEDNTEPNKYNNELETAISPDNIISGNVSFFSKDDYRPDIPDAYKDKKIVYIEDDEEYFIAYKLKITLTEEQISSIKKLNSVALLGTIGYETGGTRSSKDFPITLARFSSTIDISGFSEGTSLTVEYRVYGG